MTWPATRPMARRILAAMNSDAVFDQRHHIDPARRVTFPFPMGGIAPLRVRSATVERTRFPSALGHMADRQLVHVDERRGGSMDHDYPDKQAALGCARA